MPRVLAGALALLLLVVPFEARDLPHVVLVSIDGLLPSTYTRPGPENAPVVRRLAAEGTAAEGVIGVTPTVTFPSHTTMITGVAPAVHGIVDNRIVDPEGRSRGGWFWYAREVQAPSLLGAARSQNLVTAAVNWPVTIGADAHYLVPEFERSPHAEARHMLDALSTPGLLRAVEIARGRPLPWPFDDEARTDIARHILATYRPQLTVLHLLAVDGAQHDHGPGSREAIRAVEGVDRQLGRLVATLDETGLRRDTVLVVVSDHGFLQYGRVLHPNALFRREGLLRVNADGTIASWDAYFHSSGGAGFVYLRDASDAALRDRVGAVLSRLRDGAEGAVENLWTSADLTRIEAHPKAAFGLDVRNGWYTGSGHETLVTTTPGPRGGHGYAPDRRELHASLVVNGPGVRRGSLGVVRMTQIAPTIARLLGLTLSPGADAPITIGG